MKKGKISHLIIKTGIAQIISALTATYFTAPVSVTVSIMLCILLGIWIFGECDKYLIVCYLSITIIGAGVFILIRSFFLALSPNDIPYFKDLVDYLTLFMSIPIMSSGYAAIFLLNAKEYSALISEQK